VPGSPQIVSISSICFTDMKFRSHWPSVTPSERVFVRFPLQVILSVEAAFPSAVAPRMSDRMQKDVRRFDICDHNTPGKGAGWNRQEKISGKSLDAPLFRGWGLTEVIFPRAFREESVTRSVALFPFIRQSSNEAEVVKPFYPFLVFTIAELLFHN